MIPFALWGNNDLWNLQPTHPAVNDEKSDKLPARELLVVSRLLIVENWRLLRDAAPRSFDRQAESLIGHPIRPGRVWTLP